MEGKGRDEDEVAGVVSKRLRENNDDNEDINGVGKKSKDNDKDIDNDDNRHCHLCGGGSDGNPLVKADYATMSDGFDHGDGWLGHLVGPINDRNHIPRWLHYNCAIWSPEVYLDGPKLRNGKVSLNRGRLLKCSYCGKPGANLGCNLNACRKTYHLACARVVGCTFDHDRFLIACTEHRHVFQSSSNQYPDEANNKKLEDMKTKSGTRKQLNNVAQQMENKNGEDVDGELLNEEAEKLKRDLAKLAPRYVGGLNTQESVEEQVPILQGWESVAGLQDVIQCLKEMVVLPLLYPDFFCSHGISPPRGVLLHGHPGTGKTHVVRALVGSCSRGDKRIAFFSQKGADCLGTYVGESEQKLKLLFQVAEESQPSIIFFDEVDGLAPCRTSEHDQTHNSVVSTLLALLDGLKSRGNVVIIGATNRPNAIDPALRRPGRFDREIYFPLPSLDDRIAILSLYTQKWPSPLEKNHSLLHFIARKTVDFAGADLQALCTQTAMIALKRKFPLKQVISASGNSNRVHSIDLPVVVVEENDWLEALSRCQAPCASREMTTNNVVSSSLPSHLSVCLLRPLATLLVSLYLNKFICLPDTLIKAATIIKSVIVSALSRKKIVSDEWWSHVDDFIQEYDIANEVERKLKGSGVGLLEDSSDRFDKFIPPSCENAKRHASDNLGICKAFRILIAGNPRSGQIHLASCLVNCFIEHADIIKIDIATISQGYNDTTQGLVQILSNCSRSCSRNGLILVFMPRVELWAIESDDDDDECFEYSEPRRASHAWTVFTARVESLCHSTPLVILATSEVPFSLLPQNIRHFFNNNLSSCKKLPTIKHTIPRFSVQLDGIFNHDLVMTQHAIKISRDVVRFLDQLVHQKCHMENTTTKVKPKLLSAINKFGKKILQSTQFAKLLQVSSKLKKGPSAKLSISEWKGLQHDSYVLHRFSSLDDNDKNNENYGKVRGLVAVGILAIRGVYTSVMEVCFDIRTVLFLLVEHINNAKVDADKNRVRFLHILSMIASLEDVVYNWAYTLKSLDEDSPEMEILKQSNLNCNQIQGEKFSDEKEKVDGCGLNSSKTEPSSLPETVCLRSYCPHCLSILQDVIKKILMQEFGSKRLDWSTENVYEAATVMSMDLVRAVRKSFVDGFCSDPFDEKQKRENYNKFLESYDFKSCGCRSSRSMIGFPMECSHQLKHKTLNSDQVSTSPDLLTKLNLDSKFIYVNGELVDDFDPEKRVLFHCKFESLCLSSFIQLIVMIKKPFN